MSKKQFILRPCIKKGSFIHNNEYYQTNERKEAEEFASLLLKRPETLFIQVEYKGEEWGLIVKPETIKIIFDLIIKEYERNLKK